MTLHDFTFKFLPRLVDGYEAGTLPFHSLIDMDTWRKVFPMSEDEVIWFQIRFNAISLRAQTIMLIYQLPDPTRKGDVKYIALIVDRTKRKTTFMMLCRPHYYDEPWVICRLEGDLHTQIGVLNKVPSSRNFAEEASRYFCNEHRINFSGILKSIYHSFFDMQDSSH